MKTECKPDRFTVKTSFKSNMDKQILHLAV